MGGRKVVVAALRNSAQLLPWLPGFAPVSNRSNNASACPSLAAYASGGILLGLYAFTKLVFPSLCSSAGTHKTPS